MSADRPERLYALFQEACDLPPDKREQFLKIACADDPSLRDQVAKLLAQYVGDSSLLDEPLDVDSSALFSAPLPEHVGKYKVVRELGRGGMGIVYLAHQDAPHRRVAIKLLSAAAITARLLARFKLEADVLARLQHPYIAQIYESGTAQIAGTAQPFFAMEYVDGQPLLDYAESKELNDAAKLDLIIQLCQAVHHSHQKGVIHRDLKPANILVTSDGQLKVLDFGIARLTDADVKATTLRTNVGELIGTIPYMSLEQAEGDSSKIDTRSDVYALGVVAYQLLSGRLPYELGEQMIHEAIRVVQQQPPAPLSSIIPRLRGDVETIIGKALEKEPDRRYQSALGLEEDIRRFLSDQPIMARPPSVAYQFRKFARRNSLLVGSAATIVALLIAGVVGTSMLAWKISQQRDQAMQLKQEAESAQATAETAQATAESAQTTAEKAVEIQTAISGFLQEVFSAASPYVGNKDMTVADALDLAASRLDEQLASQPEVANAVRMRLADTSPNKTWNRIDERGWVDGIIAPADTRATLIRSLEIATRQTDERPFVTGVLQV